MTVGELKELLKDAPDDMEVLIPADCLNGFTGQSFSPCTCDTGVSELGIDEDSDETQESFIIVPYAYFEEMVGPPPELN